MSEVEFDLLLDAVQTAIAPNGEDILAQSLPLRQPPTRAANDNRPSPAWPLIPFRGVERRLLSKFRRPLI